MIKLLQAGVSPYFAVQHETYVKEVIQRAKLAGETLDVAGARICRHIQALLDNASNDGLHIIDSEDADRDYYFEENRRRHAEYVARPQFTPFPIPKSPAEVVPLIKSLSPDIPYELQVNSTEGIAFLILTQASRPEIKVNLGNYVGEVFHTIYTSIRTSNVHWNEFCLLVGQTYRYIDPPNDESAYYDFIARNVVIPSCFGAEVLLHKPEWRPCLAAANLVLKEFGTPPTYKIKDYI